MLSVVIITKNEAQNVAICLNSLSGVADEIIVIDSFSTDDTKEICEKYNVIFLQRAWEGYAETKNWGNAQAKYDWVLSIDADEALSPELRNSIVDLKKGGPQNYFYSFNRLTNYCGQWIRHGGWYPDTKLRLFDRRIAKWQGAYAHEQLVFSQQINLIRLKGDCFHYSFNSIEQHVAKVNKYSSLVAQERLAKGRKGNFFRMILGPVTTFLKFYIIKVGFLDGKNGFIIAVISAYDNFLRSAKMWQGKNQ